MVVLSLCVLDRSVVLVFFSILSAVLAVNIKYPILPVGGSIFLLLALLTWFVFLCVTFVGLHKLLLQKEPTPSTFFLRYNQYFGVPKAPPLLKPNPDSIKQLTLDLDKYFISKWYCNISLNTDFPEESKTFLEEVLTRLVEISLQINHKSVLHGSLNIYLKHLKEFRRSLRRKEKYNVGIEELYRYTHVCSTSNSKKTKEYYLHQLTTNLLRHFINSELWNSLPCHILISIISRKFTYYLLNLLSNPDVLNYVVLNALASDSVKQKLKLQDYGRVSLVEFFDVPNEEEKIEKPSEAPEETDKGTQSEQMDKEGEMERKARELEKKVEEAAKLNLSEKKVHLRPKKRHRGLKKGDTVKIYEPKSTGKTWRDQRDLACVSLGQDPLMDALQQSIPDVAGKLAAKPEEMSKHDSPPSASHIFNEVIHMTSMEGLKSSIKPISDVTGRTLHNIKDLQEATVHKIGDFQDEAAGVVEGILDFGRAGFRKGLRLTGLQDNIENAKTTFANNSASANTVTRMRDQVKKKLEELKKTDSDSQEKMSSADSADSVWINPIQIGDSPEFEGLNTSLKQPKQPNEIEATLEDLQIPSISTEQPSGSDSPDLEYEDTADLASSIAKLRSLLQQRSSESSLSTPALSPMPEDYFQKQTESENVSDVEALEVDGVMPSFYKFCTKTASGVLSNTINTIKTALPGNSPEQVYTVEKWKFASNQKESDALVKMKKLLTERKEYCVLDKEIDTAYDALDSVDIFQNSPVLMSNLQFEDELDDFEGKVPLTKVFLDILCELLADTNSALIQEPVVKAVLLLFGTTLEQSAETQIDKVLEYLAQNLITIPEKSNTRVLSVDMEEYVQYVFDGFPDILKYVVGKDKLTKALKLFVSSMQKQKINEDVFLQVFELLAMKLIEESTQISPPASA